MMKAKEDNKVVEIGEKEGEFLSRVYPRLLGGTPGNLQRRIELLKTNTIVEATLTLLLEIRKNYDIMNDSQIGIIEGKIRNPPLEKSTMIADIGEWLHTISHLDDREGFGVIKKRGAIYVYEKN